METLDQIWAGDLFDRRREAEDLVGYLESIAGKPAIREDGHAQVIAIDTAYGRGKTFFLRRLDKHLKSSDHVSAYIDAWADDLEDQPIVALAATLDRALEPWAVQSDAITKGLTEFKNKAGKVAKIVGIGLAKRGAGFLITQSAAEALAGELAAAGETTRDIVKDALKEGAKTTVDDVTAAFQPVTPSMDARIRRFRDGQAAIQAMKDSLAHVVEALAEAGMKLPITIIVDELDRCRPTYAIKLLEEIKHLFDVNGVAFLLGLHARQLGHSVTAAYGPRFDGPAYLRRFFSRRYSLKEVSLHPLVKHLIKSLGIDDKLLDHPTILLDGAARQESRISDELISEYLRAYDLSARDAFSILESLRTALALVDSNIQLSYILPLIISHYLGERELRMPIQDPPWKIAFALDRFGHEIQQHPLSDFLKNLHATAKLSDMDLSVKLNNNDPYARIVTNVGFKNSSRSYKLLQNYSDLVQAVSRFS